MKKILYLTTILFLMNFQGVFSQPANDTVIYLITCGPGTETYSIYGHSALRVKILSDNSDVVYNWGVFDFDTPNFAWKFAKGRLDYMLVAEKLQSFMQGYYFEKRYVLSQRINISASETKRLIDLINENLKPENVKYRYDFFYDDCTTRIRDLLEKSVGENLLYPPEVTGKSPTFREMVGKYQNMYPWLKFGVDLLMGYSADKKTSFRDRMFLPIDMKNELSETVINRSGRMIPLLQNPEILLDFETPKVKQIFFTTPVFVFTLLLIFVIILSAMLKSKKTIKLIDIFIFGIFSVLSVLMIFFNFFTDHQQMKWNLNIIWLSPFILLCLLSLLLNRAGTLWFRIVFFISVLFLAIQIVLPQSFNYSFFPLVIMLVVRSSVRAGFQWNPLSIK
jgi:hypothetical protein